MPAIHERDHRWQDLLRAKNLGQFGQSSIWHADDAHIRLDRGEGVIGRQDVVLGQGIKKGGLAHIGHTDNSD
jgi:hypothetical protein